MSKSLESEHFVNGTVGSNYCKGFSFSGGCAVDGFGVF